MPDVVPGTTAPAAVDPVSLIPAAHLPGAMQAASQSASSNPNVVDMLRSMQAQINSLMNGQTFGEQPDVVMVNPSGRIVEISGELSVEYLAKPGFRKATVEEETNYRKVMLRQTPEYLRRLEKKRLQDESKLFDELEEEDLQANTPKVDLLRTDITDAQKTGALEPAAVAAQQATANPVVDVPAVNPDNNTPVPNRRSNKKK